MMHTKKNFNPDLRHQCLLIQPMFAASNFWNMKEALKTIGAQTNSPPLGLLTVASLLPQHWEFKLVDLNVRDLSDEDWDWADVVCVGGMLPQQEGILNCMDEARARGKFLMVGGPDPSSQPELYKDADVLVVGEAEDAIPMWLEASRKGNSRGVFKSEQRPDVTKSPIPRYDLVDFKNYLQVTVQYSRGCPFNCEFCDIIELYGRTPRTKTPEQLCEELEVLLDLGYRGWVDIVDDNFIGNKRQVKQMLPVLEEWCKKYKYPFYFSTEASMNLADDVKLMEMMQKVDFRFVFMGIETPDPQLLMATQKSQNTMKPIQQRIQKMYDYGLSVSAGFILGFDGEPKGVDRSIIQCIQETGITVAMVGLLVALPNTQLTRRLLKQDRLLDPTGKSLILSSNNYSIKLRNLDGPAGRDQTTAGLNFITTRDRDEILDEFVRVIKTIYSPKVYMDRVLSTIKRLKLKRKHYPKSWELRRNLRGLIELIRWHNRNSETRFLFWRNFFYLVFMGLDKFELGMTFMGSYLHLAKSREHMATEALRGKAISTEKYLLKKIFTPIQTEEKFILAEEKSV